MNFAWNLTHWTKRAELYKLTQLTRWILSWDGMHFSLENAPITTAFPYHDSLFLIPARDSVKEPLAPNLTKLDFHGRVDTYEVQLGLLSMLRHCPSLEELAISLTIRSGQAVPLFEDEPSCMLPRLRKFQIGGTLLRIHTFPLLLKLRAPALHTLEVFPGLTLAVDFISNITDFITNSEFGAPVQVALFQGCEYEEGEANSEALDRLFGSLPGLTHLFLICFGPGCCRGIAQDGVFPFLVALYIDFIYFWDNEDNDELAMLLKTRFDHCPGFHATLRIVEWDDAAKHILLTDEWIQGWMKEGRLTLIQT